MFQANIAKMYAVLPAHDEKWGELSTVKEELSVEDALRLAQA